MKKRVLIVELIILFLFFPSMISAAVVLGNKSSEITMSYAPEEILKGWVNISLINEPANSLFTNNINSGSYSLIRFLEESMFSEYDDYNCIPKGCENQYFASNSAYEKSFSMIYSEEKIVALKIQSSRVNSINSLSFDVLVSNEKSCINPVQIDLLNDGSADWKAKKYSSDISCAFEDGTGCFNKQETLSEVPIGSIQFCMKIKLIASKKFSLGAWVKKGTTSWANDLLSMELYGLSDSSRLASCSLPEPSLAGGEISCNVTYDNPEMSDYYVCLKAKQNTDYTTKTESTNSCGFYATGGIFTNTETIFHDYYLFAKGAPFDNIGSFTFNQAEYASQRAAGNPETLAQYLSDYIAEFYSNNCTNGCVIPIKIKAYKGLNVRISNISIAYSTDLSAQSNNKIYDTIEEPGKINSGFLKFDLSLLNITLPKTYGNKTAAISLGGTNLINQNVYIKNLPVINSLFPTLFSTGTPVIFNVDAYSSNSTVINYKWEFGDGSSDETEISSVRHTYSSLGSYTLRISVTDESGAEASKEFSIIAGNPKDALNLTLKKDRENLNRINQELENYPGWYKKELLKKSGVDNLDAELKIYEKKFTIASSDEEYVSIILNLSALNIPNKIEKSNMGTVPLIVNPDYIDLDALENLGAGSYNSEEADKYKEAIAVWASESDINIDFFTLSFYYDNEIVPIASYFKMNIIPNENQEIENYFVINKEAIINSQDVKEIGDKITGVRFDSLNEKEIEFVVFEDADATNLPVYTSPQFSKLEISAELSPCNNNGKCETGETWKNCRKDCRPIGLTIIYICILIFAAFVSYIILQEWYKRKYESHLFRNKNDLFNLVNFISNAQAKGLDKKEIDKRLKQYGWNSEQITYAYKKVKGKKTGMLFEINFKLPEFGKK